MTTALSEADRQKLAEKLAKLSYQAARKEIRRLDVDADLKVWRNGVRHELHTMYECPNLGVRVILVEEGKTRPIPESDLVKKDYYYVEARVESWGKTE